jgi:DNA-binding response OmpR family regulator
VPLRLGILTVDPAARRVHLGGNEIHLTPTEFDLLASLAAAPGTVATRERLLEEVWGWADASGTRTVDSHVKALRAKVGPAWIRTVHGVGYALEDGSR